MHVLFVCSGNTCRSPLAEVIARDLAQARGLTGVRVSSAGTSAWPDATASDGSLLVALEHGLDLNGHRARQLSPAIVEASDLILTMGPQHLAHVEAMGGRGRGALLADYALREQRGRAIGDPFGGDLSVYRETFTELHTLIAAALDRLQEDSAPPHG